MVVPSVVEEVAMAFEASLPEGTHYLIEATRREVILLSGEVLLLLEVAQEVVLSMLEMERD